MCPMQGYWFCQVKSLLEGQPAFIFDLLLQKLSTGNHFLKKIEATSTRKRIIDVERGD